MNARSRPSHVSGAAAIRCGGRGRGLTLLEVLVAMALLGMIAAFLLQLHVDALRHAAAQRDHASLTQLIRSEAEVLRAGGGGPGSCASLDPAVAADGVACEVVRECAYPVSLCQAAPGLVPYVIRASSPRGSAAEVAILVRTDVARWTASYR